MNNGMKQSGEQKVKQINSILPPATIGILGGGQLGESLP